MDPIALLIGLAGGIAAGLTMRLLLLRQRRVLVTGHAVPISGRAGAALPVILEAPLGVLIVMDGDPAQRDRIRIRPHMRLVAGRDPANDLILPTPAAARFHFAISSDAHQVSVEDLGSPGGTYVNDEIVRKPRVLLDGDVIRADASYSIEYQTPVADI